MSQWSDPTVEEIEGDVGVDGTTNHLKHGRATYAPVRSIEVAPSHLRVYCVHAGTVIETRVPHALLQHLGVTPDAVARYLNPKESAHGRDPAPPKRRRRSRRRNRADRT